MPCIAILSTVILEFLEFPGNAETDFRCKFCLLPRLFVSYHESNACSFREKLTDINLFGAASSSRNQLRAGPMRGRGSAAASLWDPEGLRTPSKNMRAHVDPQQQALRTRNLK